MFKRRRMLALVIGCGFIAGCARVPNTNYYTLVYPRPRRPVVYESLGATLAIDRVLADSLHRQSQIIYYTPPNTVNMYFYHRWATPPPEMLAQRLHDQFAASGLFKQVTTYAPGEDTDYVLRATIVKLAEVDEPTGARVVVELSAKLLEGGTGKPIWMGTGADERTVSLTNMEEIVNAMNEGVEASVSQIIAGVHQALMSVRAESKEAK